MLNINNHDEVDKLGDTKFSKDSKGLHTWTIVAWIYKNALIHIRPVKIVNFKNHRGGPCSN